MSELRITEVNYDAITQNFIDYLRDQDEFKDLDFNASVIRRIISMLAYDQHMSSYYANALFRERFLDSASLRPSVISAAKRYGYTPYSIKAPRAQVDVRLENGSSILNQYIELPKGSVFNGTTRDRSKTYTFVTAQAYQIYADTLDLTFTDVELVQGTWASHDFRVDKRLGEWTMFELPADDIDTTYLEVYVQEGSDNSSFSRYQLANGRLTSSEDEVFWLEEGPNGRFQIYFGDGIIGKDVTHGKVVRVLYIKTKGEEANNIEEFTFNSSTDTFRQFLTSSFSSIVVSTLDPASGGSVRETTEQVRYRASRYRGNGMNALRIQDYEEVIMSTFPEIASIRIWDDTFLEESSRGGGKIYIAAIPQNGRWFTQRKKNEMTEKIQRDIAGVNKCIEFVDPDYLYPYIHIDVEMRPNHQGRYSTAIISTLMKDVMERYNLFDLNKFGSKLEPSKLVHALQSIDGSIDNLIMSTSLETRISPELGVSRAYNATLDNPISEGTLTSAPFYRGSVYGKLKDNGAGRIDFVDTDTEASITNNVGQVNYATGEITLNIMTVTQGSSWGDIRIRASVLNRNIVTTMERALRLERDNVTINFFESTTRMMDRYC